MMNNPSPTTLSALLQQSIQRFPDSVAMQFEENSILTRYTYAELDLAAKAAVEQFKTMGIQPGMRVVLLSENRPELVITLLALWTCQATAVILDTALEPSDYESLIQDANPVAAIVSQKLREKLASIQTIPVLDLQNGLPRPAKSAGLAMTPDRDNDPAVAVILYTSGTTGRFKGVVLTHENLLFTIQTARVIFGATHQDNVLCLLPVYHVFGLVAALLIPLTVSASITFVEKLQSDVILKAMQMSGCTILPAVPRLLDLFAAGIDRQVSAKPISTQIIFRTLYFVSGLLRSWFDYNLGERLFKPVHATFGGKLRMIVSGGASLDKNIFSQLEALGFTVVEGYGLTEAASLVAVNTPTRRKMGSVGIPVPGTQVELFNTNAMGEGEIVVKGPHIMRGYFRDPDTTKLALQDGWFHTGDLGKFDAKGNLIITGRIKELIVKPNGEKAMPEDIERRYRGVEGITELAVVGMPAKEGYGEEIHAAIMLAEGATELDVKNRILERSLQVPSTLRIQECHFVTSFPKTSTMKVKRKKLVQQLSEKTPPLQKGGVAEGGGGIFAKSNIEDPTVQSIHDVILTVISPGTRARLTQIKPEFSIQFDLGLDSLSRMELAQAIQQKFSIRFEEKQLVVLYTVGDLIQAVKNAKPGQTDLTSLDTMPMMGTVRAIHRTFIGRWIQQGLFFVLQKFMKFYFHVETKGEENLPKDTRFIIAANHSSHLDAPSLAVASGLPIDSLVFMAAKDYNFGYASILMNIAPFERNLEMVGLLHNVQDCRYYIGQGKNLVIFPEGTRSPSGHMQTFKSAVALIAVELGIPIVPVYISGTYASLPRGNLFPKRGKITVTFGAPLYVKQAETGDYQAYKTITSELRQRIEKLSEL